jgi:GMP synthase-like glutamine amidotransferase
MEEVLVFQHDPFEDLGFFAEILEKEDAGYRTLRLFHGEMPAEDWRQIAAVIILGGPMSVDDEERFPFLRWEKRIIRAALDESVPILGVCLGAQLIAAVLGSRVYDGPVREIGWHPISTTPHGQVDSLLGYLPENATVFQWHSQGCDLPPGAVCLAASTHYKTQAFRLGKLTYGLQFHLEVTPPMIERWIGERSKDLARTPYVSAEKIKADTRIYSQTLRYYAERFFAEFLRRIERAKTRKREAGLAQA